MNLQYTNILSLLQDVRSQYLCSKTIFDRSSVKYRTLLIYASARDAIFAQNSAINFSIAHYTQVLPLPNSTGYIIWCKSRMEDSWGLPNQDVLPVYQVIENRTAILVDLDYLVWSPGDYRSQWLETLGYMAQNSGNETNVFILCLPLKIKSHNLLIPSFCYQSSTSSDTPTPTALGYLK